MTGCAKCAEAASPAGARSLVRSGDVVYHLECAPPELIESGSEEYRAILRKGVRYFVEKYAVDRPADPELGGRFLELGRALDAERARRARR